MGGRTPLFGGEEDGAALRPNDVEAFLADALKTYLYNRLEHREFRLAPDRTYTDNRSFWLDALGYQHFPGTYCILEDFTLTEWLPFSPGRSFTESAHQAREHAERFIADNGREYLPNGKLSMVKGGIGCIRLAERSVRSSTLFFLGASSSGVAHEGIPHCHHSRRVPEGDRTNQRVRRWMPRKNRWDVEFVDARNASA
jgi:hypothetical protein